jgi:transcription antitermination factor NusG
MLETQGPNSLAWFALKVRTRGEFLVGESLRHRGTDVFLPTYLECRRYSDRIKKVPAALFPGYLFCRIDSKYRLPILTTPGVEHFVGAGNRPAAIPESEIAAIQRVTESGAAAIPWPYLIAGQKIRIECGALAGLEGLVAQVRGSERLILSVHLLQRSVCVEIDRSWIRPLAAAGTDGYRSA